MRRIFFLFLIIYSAQVMSEQLKLVSSVKKHSLTTLISSGESVLLETTVLADDKSLFAEALGAKEAIYYFEKVIDPTGKIIIGKIRDDIKVPTNQLGEFAELRFAENPVIQPIFKGGTAVLIPNRPEVKLTPGKWKFYLRIRNDGISKHKAEINFYTKKIDGEIDEKTYGLVKVNFLFTGTDINELNYKNDEYFNRFQDSLSAVLGTAGIYIQIQSANDSNAIPASILTDNESLFNESLVKNSKYSTKSGITIFISKIKSSLRGISWGLPSPMTSEKFNNAIIISLDKREGDSVNTLKLKAQSNGAIAAHEIGHYLGLFHVAENEPRFYDDGLSDTEFELHSNIMMPDASYAPLSTQQRMIMLLNPLIEVYRER